MSLAGPSTFSIWFLAKNGLFGKISKHPKIDKKRCFLALLAKNPLENHIETNKIQFFSIFSSKIAIFSKKQRFLAPGEAHFC
jgi:hypothetical protein